MIEKIERSYSERFQNKEKSQYYKDIVYSKGSYYSLMSQIELGCILSEIKKSQKNKLVYLDFACGTGRIISQIEDYVEIAIGIDISKQMLNIAKKRVKKAKLIRRDIIKHPLKKKFNLITAFRFFLNAESKLRLDIIERLTGMLKHDGKLIFSIHGNKYSFRLFTYLISRAFGKKLNQLSYWEVKKWLEENGLELIDFNGIGLLPKQFYKIKRLRNILIMIDKTFHKLGFGKKLSHIMIFTVKVKE